MPKGKYTLADVAPDQPQRYTMADVDTSPGLTPPPQERQGLLSSASDSSGLSTIGNALLHPIDMTKNIADVMVNGAAASPDNPIIKGIGSQVESTVSNLKDAGQYARERNLPGVITSGIHAIPGLGPTLEKSEDQWADKNYAGSIGTNAGFVGSLFGPKVLKEGAGKLLRPAAKAAAVGDVTRMIRPNTTDTSFGKAPAEGLLRQPGGIYASSKEALLEKSRGNLNKIGQQIGDTVKNAPQTPIDISDAVVNPMDDALAKAATNNERGLFSSLQETKKGLTSDLFYDPSTESIEQRVGPKNLTAVTPTDLFDLKKRVGDSVRWTNQAFENDLNSAKGSVYGGLKEKLNQAVPEVAPLNKDYGDLRAGMSALERRIPIENRNNAISLPDTVATAGGIASGHPGYALAGLAGKKLVNATPFRTGIDSGLFSYGTSAPKPLTAAPSALFYAPAKRDRQPR